MAPLAKQICPQALCPPKRRVITGVVCYGINLGMYGDQSKWLAHEHGRAYVWRACHTFWHTLLLPW